jgi:hypothetical protein
MSSLEKIAYFQKRRDEIPNQELAANLAQNQDKEGIQEIADNLFNKNKNISSDCIKVLYEIGYLQPDLIAPYATDFLKLLDSRENRMVWGSMIALACIAHLEPELIFAKVDLVMDKTRNGSVITQVWGIRTLSRIAGANDFYRSEILPFLENQIQTCLPRDIPLHLESMLPAIRPDHSEKFRKLAISREQELTSSQGTRLKAVLNKL